MSEYDSAFREGYAGYLFGEENPYPEDSRQARIWREGWEKAYDDEMERFG